MNIEKHIALACFLGATIGALVALQLNHYLWWLGIIIGGGIGYITYDFMGFVRTAHGIWKSMSQSMPKVKSGVETYISNKLPDILLIVGLFCAIYSIALLAIGIIMSIQMVNGFIRYNELIGSVFQDLGTSDYWVGSTLLVTIACLCFSYLLENEGEERKSRIVLYSSIFLTPMSILVIFPLAVLCLTIWMIYKSFTMIPLMIKTTKRTFILVHSELRLLCMTDAAIGAVIGYSCGNAIIGGIVGAICGILNYRLVSVRWLKLVPA